MEETKTMETTTTDANQWFTVWRAHVKDKQPRCCCDASPWTWDVLNQEMRWANNIIQEEKQYGAVRVEERERNRRTRRFAKRFPALSFDDLEAMSERDVFPRCDYRHRVTGKWFVYNYMSDRWDYLPHWDIPVIPVVE